MISPGADRSLSTLVRSSAVAVLMFGLVWLASTLVPPAVAWHAGSGVYGDEFDGTHRFRWLSSPAEIVINVRSAADVVVRADWRSAFNPEHIEVEVEVNGQHLDTLALDQNLKPLVWPKVHLTEGRNIIRFVSSAGAAPISPQDERRVAFGMRDLRITGPSPTSQSVQVWFVISVMALGLIVLRVPSLLGLAGTDALGVGFLSGFAAIAGSATLLSAFGLLTGPAWAVALLVIALATLVARAAPTGAELQNPPWLSLVALAVPIFVVGAIQLLTPVNEYDDLMQHGSRAGYWLGQHSVFPFASHNERQEVFPYSGDLFFALGVFTGRCEAAGRCLVGFAYPATLLLVWGFLRKRGVTEGIAVGAALIVGFIPQVRESAIGIKPDLWGLVFALVALNAATDGWLDFPAPRRKIYGVILIGAVCAAIAVKATFLLLMPLAFVPLCLARSLRERLLYAGIALPLGVLIFGLATTFIHNRNAEGGWLGSPAMTAVHRPDSVDGMVRNVKRLPFLMIGLPWVPNEAVQLKIEASLVSLATVSGASSPLPMEAAGQWPGLFVPTVPTYDNRYSLFWLFALAATIPTLAGLNRLVRDRSGQAALGALGLGLILIVGITCSVRWQVYSEVPLRFLVPGAVLTVVALAWCWHLTARFGPAAKILLPILIAFHAVPFAHDLAVFRDQYQMGLPAWQPSSVLSPAADAIAPGSRVLVFASQSSGDYVLFQADLGFPNDIRSWGRQPYSAKAFAAVITAFRPDYIVFEQAGSVDLHWHEPLHVKPFIDSLENSEEFSREPRGEPNVIFRRHARKL